MTPATSRPGMANQVHVVTIQTALQLTVYGRRVAQVAPKAADPCSC